VIGPDFYSFRALWRHYRQCRSNKRNTANALAFEVNAEANLLALQQELRTHTYRPGRSICFITDGPKPREVFAADFRDRVVHHLLVSHQERVFEPRFIYDSYACRRGKGTLAASDRLMTFLRQITANGRRQAWALKLDVTNFFPSVYKATLYEIIAGKIVQPELLWLTRTLLFHDPTTNYRFQCRIRRVPGPESPNYPVPPHKSLFGKQNERGLPIGNLTSQFWGNVYLNELDQFVKRTLKCRYYLRYVDDMVLLAQDRQELGQWCAAIEEFLREQLKLELRPEMTDPFPVGRGIDFVGWKTWWNRRVPRRRTLGNVRARLENFERAAVRPVRSGRAQRIDLRRQDTAGSVERLRSTLASYAGHLRHGAALHAWEEVWRRYPWLTALFAHRRWLLTERWSRCGIVRACDFRSQYWSLVRYSGNDCLECIAKPSPRPSPLQGEGEKCPLLSEERARVRSHKGPIPEVLQPVLVFCQVGRFIEFYGPQRVAAMQALGLRVVALPRAGYAFTVGFPARLSGPYTARAIRQGLIVVEVRQAPTPPGRGCSLRLPCAVLVPTRTSQSGTF
jgi:RNA-directed DNA polymerase